MSAISKIPVENRIHLVKLINTFESRFTIRQIVDRFCSEFNIAEHQYLEYAVGQILDELIQTNNLKYSAGLYFK